MDGWMDGDANNAQLITAPTQTQKKHALIFCGHFKNTNHQATGSVRNYIVDENNLITAHDSNTRKWICYNLVINFLCKCQL